MARTPLPEEEKKKCIVGLKVTKATHDKLKEISYFNNVTISELFLKYLPEILATEVKYNK